MNKILQKRIEEEAKNYADSLALPEWDKRSIHAIDFKKGAVAALQNLWISVEEALPEDKTKVFVIVKTPVGIVHRADYHINDYWYMSRYSPEEIVTHWMPIPSLEGGEK